MCSWTTVPLFFGRLALTPRRAGGWTMRRRRAFEKNSTRACLSQFRRRCAWLDLRSIHFFFFWGPYVFSREIRRRGATCRGVRLRARRVYPDRDQTSAYSVGHYRFRFAFRNLAHVNRTQIILQHTFSRLHSLHLRPVQIASWTAANVSVMKPRESQPTLKGSACASDAFLPFPRRPLKRSSSFLRHCIVSLVCICKDSYFRCRCGCITHRDGLHGRHVISVTDKTMGRFIRAVQRVPPLHGYVIQLSGRRCSGRFQELSRLLQRHGIGRSQMPLADECGR